MPLNVEYVASGANASAESIHFPLSSLVGITSGEVDGSESQPERDNKFMLGVLLGLNSEVANASPSPLGMATARGNLVGAGSDLLNQNVAFTFSSVANFADGSIDVYPLPSSDDGLMPLSSAFSNIEKVSGTAAASNDGLSVAYSDLEAFGSFMSFSNLTFNGSQDHRALTRALMAWMIENADLRGGNTASAVVSKGRSNATGIAPPGNITDITSLTESQLITRGFLNVSFNATMQYRINPSQQTYDVNVSTS